MSARILPLLALASLAFAAPAGAEPDGSHTDAADVQRLAREASEREMAMHDALRLDLEERTSRDVARLTTLQLDLALIGARTRPREASAHASAVPADRGL